eukprot:m.62855 g.62855  ORF g.62855 m.62855 type:complete len:332 (-) comp11539_c0_seq3:141-1136(-)
MSVANAETVPVRIPAFRQLQDKIALVTGASGGLGSAIAEAYALHGADVICTYLDGEEDEVEKTAKAVVAAGRKVLTVKCNVAKEEEVINVIEKIDKEFHRLDICVAVAGIGKMAPFLQVKSEDFEAVHNVNVFGTFVCMREAGKLMKRLGIPGNIITISSIHGLGGTHFNATYGSSKAAIIALTKGAAFDLADDGIRCNSIAPGAVPVPNDPCPTSDYPIPNEEDRPTEMTDAWMQYTPLARWGGPDEVASVAVFLASEASSFMTGQVISVDGGVSAGVKIPSFRDFKSKHRGLPEELKGETVTSSEKEATTTPQEDTKKEDAEDDADVAF